MNSILKRFTEPLPWWIEGIKQESFKKIWQSTLLKKCQMMDQEAMRVLMFRFWPFVNEFPKIISEHRSQIFLRELVRHPIHVYFLAKNVNEILKEIRSDEINHRSLWLTTSAVLGLKEDDLYFQVLKDFRVHNSAYLKVRGIIKKVQSPVSILGNKTTSQEALLRLAAVEIVAEGISLIVKDAFKRLNDKAGRWFDVHIYHNEDIMSHEELVYKLAFAFDSKKPEREPVNVVIQEIVDLFIEAGEISY